MKKILFIANTGVENDTKPNGVTIKNLHILRFLKSIKNIKITIINTVNWKKHILSLFFKILVNSINNHKIILSIDTNSAYQIIRFFSLIKLNKKLIYIVVGGSLPNKIKNGYLKKKYYTSIDVIYVQTKKMLNDLNQLGLSNVVHLPNSKYFEDIEVNYNKEIQNTIKCFYLGRIHPDKGVDLIFNAFKVVNNKKTKFEIDFYGPIEEVYADYFHDKLKNTNYARYKGVIDLYNNQKNYSKLSEYDLFIFPTFWSGEGFPGVVIDSFISGVPVIASDWNHNTEVIQDGYNGIIFRSKDINDLIDKLYYVDNNRDKLIEFKRNAHSSSRKFKSENVLVELASQIEK